MLVIHDGQVVASTPVHVHLSQADLLTTVRGALLVINLTKTLLETIAGLFNDRTLYFVLTIIPVIFRQTPADALPIHSLVCFHPTFVSRPDIETSFRFPQPYIFCAHIPFPGQSRNDRTPIKLLELPRSPYELPS